MQYVDTDSAAGCFHVVGGTDRSQAATMRLDPGETTGGSSSYHADSDQWLCVKAGAGTVVIDGESHEISAGELLLVEAGETHEIRNDGDAPLETVTVSAPPEY